MKKTIFEFNHLEILNEVYRIWKARDNKESNIRQKYNCYYLGCTLCVDVPESNDVLCYNLNEKVSFFGNGQIKLLGINEVKMVFDIFENVIGKSEYYNQNFNNSIIRHLV